MQEVTQEAVLSLTKYDKGLTYRQYSSLATCSI